MAEVAATLAELQVTIADIRDACMDQSFARAETHRALEELHAIVHDFLVWARDEATRERDGNRQCTSAVPRLYGALDCRHRGVVIAVTRARPERF